jgi:hypothetical protein
VTTTERDWCTDAHGRELAVYPVLQYLVASYSLRPIESVPLTNTFPGRHFQWDGGSTLFGDGRTAGESWKRWWWWIISCEWSLVNRLCFNDGLRFYTERYQILIGRRRSKFWRYYWKRCMYRTWWGFMGSPTPHAWPQAGAHCTQPAAAPQITCNGASLDSLLLSHCVTRVIVPSNGGRLPAAVAAKEPNWFLYCTYNINQLQGSQKYRTQPIKLYIYYHDRRAFQLMCGSLEDSTFLPVCLSFFQNYCSIMYSCSWRNMRERERCLKPRIYIE